MKGIIAALLSMLLGAAAFVPIQYPRASAPFVASRSFGPASDFDRPTALVNQRKSVAQVQTMGLFGLGAPEVAIILVAAAFLLGPQKLAELGKDAGKIAGELKEVPKEFQKGLEEGEMQAKEIKKELQGGDTSDTSAAKEDSD